MSRIFRFGLIALALLLAPILFLQGQANAGNIAGPATSWNGFKLAELALGSLRLEQTETDIQVSVNSRGLDLARQAFAKEPLATDALFLLALNERSQGNLPRMQAILERADALDKRNRNIGALQLEQATRSADLEQAFGIIDRLATVHPNLTRDFVRPLVAAMAEPRTIPVLRDALAEEPVWASSFWNAVPVDPILVSRMYDLRQQTEVGTSSQSDAALLAGLVAQGRFRESFLFWEQVSGEEHDPTGFVAGEAFPPFGWEFVTSGELSMTARGEQGHDVYIQNETSGDLGRQLLRLQAGGFAFTANVDPADEAANISARLECADTGEIAGEAQSLDGALHWNVSGNCEAYWLVLTGRAWNRRNALRATISDMNFRAAS